MSFEVYAPDRFFINPGQILWIDVELNIYLPPGKKIKIFHHPFLDSFGVVVIEKEYDDPKKIKVGLLNKNIKPPITYIGIKEYPIGMFTIV